MHYSGRVSSLWKPGRAFRRLLADTWWFRGCDRNALEIFRKAVFREIKGPLWFASLVTQAMCTHNVQRREAVGRPTRLSLFNRSCVVTRGAAIARYSCLDSIQFQFAHNLLRAENVKHIWGSDRRGWPADRLVNRIVIAVDFHAASGEIEQTGACVYNRTQTVRGFLIRWPARARFNWESTRARSRAYS